MSALGLLFAVVVSAFGLGYLRGREDGRTAEANEAVERKRQQMARWSRMVTKWTRAADALSSPLHAARPATIDELIGSRIIDREPSDG